MDWIDMWRGDYLTDWEKLQLFWLIFERYFHVFGEIA